MKDPYIRHPVRLDIQVKDLVTIHYFEYGKDYKYQGESHDFWEMMYADRGSITVKCGQEDHLLSRGDLILLPPNEFHDLRSDTTTPSNVFIISFTEIGKALPSLGGQVFHLTLPMKDLIRAILREGESVFVLPMPKNKRECLQTRSDASFGGEQLIKLWLEQLLILLCREATSPNRDKPRTRYDGDIASRILSLLQENLYGQLTLSEITAAMGYGKTHLSNAFKRVHGHGIMEHYMQIKIEEAKYLLRDGTMSVSQISDHMGFSSPQYFSKCFSKLVHMSPRQYANSVRENWSTGSE